MKEEGEEDEEAASCVAASCLKAERLLRSGA